MPNICRCKVRLGANPETILLLKEAEFSFETLFPQPAFPPLEDISGEDNRWYDWRMENWGTKWNRFQYKVKHIGDAGMEIQFQTAWSPPTEFFKRLVKKYPEIWLKCEWFEEGGVAGIDILYMNNKKEVQTDSFVWSDWCEEEWYHRMKNDDLLLYIHRPRSHCKDDDEYNAKESEMAIAMTRGEQKKFKAEIQNDFLEKYGREPDEKEIRTETIRRKADLLWPEYKQTTN